AISTIESESMSRSSTNDLSGVTSDGSIPVTSSTISASPAMISASVRAMCVPSWWGSPHPVGAVSGMGRSPDLRRPSVRDGASGGAQGGDRVHGGLEVLGGGDAVPGDLTHHTLGQADERTGRRQFDEGVHAELEHGLRT